MGTIRVSHLGWRLPGGDELLRDVSFIVRDGDRAALVGANGVGKSTLLSLIAGDLQATTGTLTIDGRLGVMRQFVGVAGRDEDEQDSETIIDLLLSLAPASIRDAASRLRTAEQHAAADPICYANALAAWGDTGGYDAELHWDDCAMRSVGLPVEEIGVRPLRTFSGGEQKRIALEVLLRGDADVLLLDEPDNFLDVEAKRWLEGELAATRKTVLYVSHDRELLAATATKIVTVEAEGSWTHGGGFAGYGEARRSHLNKLERDRTLYSKPPRADYASSSRARSDRRTSASSASTCVSVVLAPVSGRSSSSDSTSMDSPIRSTSRSISVTAWPCSAATGSARATFSGC